jgi:hypothetical protein
MAALLVSLERNGNRTLQLSLLGKFQYPYVTHERPVRQREETGLRDGLAPSAWFSQMAFVHRLPSPICRSCKQAWPEPSHPYQQRPVTPGSRRRRGARRKAILSCCRRKRFSTSSRRRDRNRSATKVPSSCRIAIIASHDALVLPHRANPRGSNFQERQAECLRCAVQLHSVSRCRPVIGIRYARFEKCWLCFKNFDT